MPKTASQVLFDRLVRTWILPAAEERQTKDPTLGTIPLRLALLVWTTPQNPEVFFNDEVFGRVIKMEIVTTRPFPRNHPVTADDLQGIRRVVLRSTLAVHPHIFVLQGREEKFYFISRDTPQVLNSQDFEALNATTATEGVLLSGGEQHMHIFLDVLRNAYDYATSRTAKLRAFRGFKDRSARNVDASARAKRHLKLPTLMAHADDEFLPLLLETRSTYIAGHFFSAIASAVTTADRICIRLTQRFGLPVARRRQILKMTFAQKIEPLRADHLVTGQQEKLLRRLNAIRNRHVHPRRTPSALTSRRDALTAIKLLHEFLEGTFSVFRDYVIDNGRFVPRPLD